MLCRAALCCAVLRCAVLPVSKSLDFVSLLCCFVCSLCPLITQHVVVCFQFPEPACIAIMCTLAHANYLTSYTPASHCACMPTQRSITFWLVSANPVVTCWQLQCSADLARSFPVSKKQAYTDMSAIPTGQRRQLLEAFVTASGTDNRSQPTAHDSSQADPTLQVGSLIATQTLFCSQMTDCHSASHCILKTAMALAVLSCLDWVCLKLFVTIQPPMETLSAPAVCLQIMHCCH